MLLRILGPWLFAASLAAQVTSVSTYGDGAAVFFTTEMRPIGADDPLGFKAYRLDSGGAALFAPPRVDDHPGLYVHSILADADGDTVAVNRANPCRIGTACVNAIQEFSEIRVGEKVRRFEGYAQVSANGRYALLLRRSGFGFRPQPEESMQAVRRLRLDDPDAEPESLGRFPGRPGLRWIADNGSVLLVDDGWRLQPVDGEAIELNLMPRASDAWLLSDASGVVYERVRPDAQTTEEFGELRLHRVEGGDVGLGAVGELVAVSDDDRVVLYLAEVNGVKQAFRLQLAGGAGMQLTNSAAGVEAAALSSDGEVAYVFADGVLSRVSLGGEEALIGPLLAVDPPDYRPVGSSRAGPIVAPGSTYRIFGRRLAETVTVAASPAGDELDGIRLSVNGTAAAVLWTSPNEIGYQAAWDTELGELPRSTIVVSDEESGWEYPYHAEAVRALRPANALPRSPGGRWRCIKTSIGC